MNTLEDLRMVSSQRRAREVIRYFAHVLEGAYAHFLHYTDFVRELKRIYDELISQLPLDSVTLSCLSIVFPHKRVHHFDSMQKLYELIKERIVFVQNHLDVSITTIPELGSFKLKKNVFVFGHEHDILNVLLAGLTKGMVFEVHITEQRSTMTGSLFAAELHKHGIKVHYYADAAIRQAIKNCDVVLIGANAIDYHLKTYTTVGAELACLVAQHYKRPVYVVTDSWAFNRTLESESDLTQYAENNTQAVLQKHTIHNFEKMQVTQSENFVPVNLGSDSSLFFIKQWNVPSGVFVHYFTFEKVHPKLITGIISELGILTPMDFFMKVKERYDSYF
jgi:translation initiation factor 2B subunit (eIF-2B alpha/beta/delta family)